MKQFTGILLIAISAASFGTLAIFGRFLYADGLDTFTMLFLRFGVAAVLMAVILILRRETLPRGKILLQLVGNWMHRWKSTSGNGATPTNSESGACSPADCPKRTDKKARTINLGVALFLRRVPDPQGARPGRHLRGPARGIEMKRPPAYGRLRASCRGSFLMLPARSSALCPLRAHPWLCTPCTSPASCGR